MTFRFIIQMNSKLNTKLNKSEGLLLILDTVLYISI